MSTAAPVQRLSIPVITNCRVRAYRIPTDAPEADGTFSWNSTILVLVEVRAEGMSGLGFTYADVATAQCIEDHLAECLRGLDARDIPTAWNRMVRKIRNLGRPGIAAMAISAVDTALWDLKAKLLDLPLAKLFGMVRDHVPVYGSGGFTSYSLERLREQLSGWASKGIRMVKMKVGQHPEEDPQRVRAAREAIGPETQLFVDANGAYSRKQALAMAQVFVEEKVFWFEEPVSSDDLEGLRLMRDRAPVDMAIAAGEYGYDLYYFRRMLESGAVDILQDDVTRCGGFTGFLQVAALCQAFGIPLSGHTSPSLHCHVATSLANVCHIEYFHDHSRIEHMLFDGASTPQDGVLRPNLLTPGMGLVLKEKESNRYAIYASR